MIINELIISTKSACMCVEIFLTRAMPSIQYVNKTNAKWRTTTKQCVNLEVCV